MLEWLVRRREEYFNAHHRLRCCRIDEIRAQVSRDGYWKYFFHPGNSYYREDIIGKWVYHDTPEKLEVVSLDLLVVMAEGLSSVMKYKRSLNNPDGPFGHLWPPLCVYSTEGCKSRLAQRIKELGLKDIYWQSDKATIKLHQGLREQGISSDSY